MANRFTDTTKWKRPWFRGLGLHAKLVWMYLCDECDHAGIWIADFEVASLQLGFKLDREKLSSWLGDKIVQVDHDRYFIPSFFDYQYGNAKDGFKAKQSALKVLKSYGLVEESSDSLRDLSNSTLRVSGQSPDCLSISIGIGKGNTGGVGDSGDAASAEDYEAVYQRYPKKVGKSNGLAKLKKLCPTKTSLADFARAMDIYVAKCRSTDTFLKNFDTFVNWSWRDCLEPGYGDDAQGQPDIDWSFFENEREDAV